LIIKANIVEQVNAAIGKAGGKQRLRFSRVGGAFFYFDLDRGVPSDEIPVSPESTVEELLEALKVEEVKDKLNPRQDC
jgi:hypothetical protein